MNLNPVPFEQIEKGLKTIEIRLFDEKRQKINIGDMIVFKKIGADDILISRVKALHKFENFELLYSNLDLVECGYNTHDNPSPDDMLEYYSREEIVKYGVVGIELCDITKSDLITYHYDLLIDENNDPVYDSEELKSYMDEYDGESFIKSLKLSKVKTVLEIGVGTGRLALKVIPHCRHFTGIDISPKTVKRAKENLKDFNNFEILLGDYTEYEFLSKFDIIYCSLTFMHIKDKLGAINKIACLLNNGGSFVLSIEENGADMIDYGTRKIPLYPDNLGELKKYILTSGLEIVDVYTLPKATVIVAVK